MKTIHHVTIIKFSSRGGYNTCRSIHVHLQETPTGYEFCDGTCTILQADMRQMHALTECYDDYLRLLRTAYKYKGQYKGQPVDLDVAGNTIIDIRNSAAVARQHMAAFCIQMYWRRARMNPMLSLGYKLQAARIENGK